MCILALLGYIISSIGGEGAKTTPVGRFYSFRNAGGAPSFQSARGVSTAAAVDLRNFLKKVP